MTEAEIKLLHMNTVTMLYITSQNIAILENNGVDTTLLKQGFTDERINDLKASISVYKGDGK